MEEYISGMYIFDIYLPLIGLYPVYKSQITFLVIRQHTNIYRRIENNTEE